MKRIDEVIKFLGRKYMSRNEYRKIYRVLFGDTMTKNRAKIKRQRQRHMQHGYNIPNRNRKFCIFCAKENRILTT